MTFTTKDGNTIHIEAPDPEKVFQELFPGVELESG